MKIKLTKLWRSLFKLWFTNCCEDLAIACCCYLMRFYEFIPVCHFPTCWTTWRNLATALLRLCFWLRSDCHNGGSRCGKLLCFLGIRYRERLARVRTTIETAVFTFVRYAAYKQSAPVSTETKDGETRNGFGEIVKDSDQKGYVRCSLARTYGLTWSLMKCSVLFNIRAGCFQPQGCGSNLSTTGGTEHCR